MRSLTNTLWPCWNVVDDFYDYEFPFPDQSNGNAGSIGGAMHCTINDIDKTASMKLTVDDDNGTWLFSHTIPIPYDLAIRFTGHINRDSNLTNNRETEP